MREQLREWDTMSDGERAARLEEQLAVIDGRIAELQLGRATVQEALALLGSRTRH